MRKQLWLPALLAILVLAVMVGNQLGVTENDWLRATRTGLDLFSRVGWPLAALGALAIALRTRERAAGLFALALLVNAAVVLGRFGMWFAPLSTIGLALAMLSWAPGALARWLLAFAGLSAALHWLYMFQPPWFGTVPQTTVVLDLVVGAFWALFAAAAWQGCRVRAWRPLLWLAWLGAFSVAMVAFTVVQLLFPVRLGAGFIWADLILLPLPLVTAFGFIWSAFPRVAVQTESRP